MGRSARGDAVPGLVVLAVGAVTLAACGGQAPPPAAATPDPGRAVYLSIGCPACHGQARQGSATAPPLFGLARHWTADELAAYLRDPAGYRAGRPRLEELAVRWSSDMPPVQLDEARLGALLRYLLESR